MNGISQTGLDPTRMSFSKKSFSPITVCISASAGPGGGGGGWGHVPPPPRVLKKFAHYMYGNGLVDLRCLGVFQWTARRLC